MAGESPDFDAAAFRASISAAMAMGLPNPEAERARLQWKVETTYSHGADKAGNPYDWSTGSSPVATEDDIDDLLVTCAVQFYSKGGDSLDSHIGSFDDPRVELTFLDEEWARIMEHSDDRKPNWVNLDDSRYKVLFTSPPLGLFDVTIYQLIAQAEDEN